MRRRNPAFVALVALALLPIAAPADPPPWAPAHGWRKKHDPDYVGYTGKRWERDYGVVEGHCDTDKVGAVVGGVVGGAVGSRVGEGDNRPVAILVGGVIGAVVGAKVGRAIDEADRACMGHALELAGEKTTVRWDSRNGVHYELTPTRNLGDQKSPCREFVTRVATSKSKDAMKGIACRRGNGDWVIKE